MNEVLFKIVTTENAKMRWITIEGIMDGEKIVMASFPHDDATKSETIKAVVRQWSVNHLGYKFTWNQNA
jgi:hypothetical protein